MTLKLDQEVRLALNEAAQFVSADPERLLRTLSNARPSRARTRWAMAASAALVVVVAATSTVLASHTFRGNSDAAYGSGDRLVPGPFPRWGPTRGSFSSDTTFLARVKAEALHPTGRENADRLFSSQKQAGPLQVLWAGPTPVGPAAVVAQSAEEIVDGVQTVFVLVAAIATDAQGQLRMMHRNMAIRADAAILTRDIAFMASSAGRYVVAVPADPSDQVHVTAHGAGVSHIGLRDWKDVPVVNGAAIADIGVGNVGLDALVHIGPTPIRADDGDIPSSWPPAAT